MTHIPEAKVRSRRPFRSAGRRSGQTVSKVLMSGPAIILVCVFLAAPLLLAFYFSFTDWKGAGNNATFIGFENYERIFTSATFGRATYVTVFIAIVTTVALNVVGLLLAMLLHRTGAITSIYRSIFFFPMVLSPIIVGFLWKTLLDYRGVVNTLITDIGLPPIEFLGNPALALSSVTWVIIWQSLGFNMVLYLAGLQNIPKSLLEAAVVDGAGPWRVFRSVTLPMLAPVVTINIVSVFIFNMREYDRIKAVTDGGPGGATQTLAYKILNEAFSLGLLGRGSAYAVVLMVGVAIVASVLIYFLRKRERELS